MKTKILLVDDDRHLLVTLGDFLRFKGFDVTPARSGEEALAALDNDTPDLIILDIGMPGMGGIAFLKRLEEEGRAENLPILVLTGRAAMEEFFAEVKVDAFLSKPCREEELLKKIREVLTRRNALAAERMKPTASVLLVEDDFEVIEDIRNTFRSGLRGITLEVATTAAEAIEKAATMSPDAILSAEILRGMNGDEMAALIRQMPGAHLIPVVLYDKTRLFDGMREYRYRLYGRVTKFVGAADGSRLYKALCEVLDS